MNDASYAADRLTTVTRSDGYTLALDDDAEGGRAQRTESTGAVADFRGSVEWRGGVPRRLVYGPGVGHVVAEVVHDGATPEVVSLYGDEAANVVRVASAANGAAPAFEPVRAYAMFGARRDGGASAVERGFAGMPVEGASGLVAMGARHYDPETGMFLQPDPLHLTTGAVYAYARQNPLRFRDPSGLAAQDIGSLRSGPPASVLTGSGFSTFTSGGVPASGSGAGTVGGLGSGSQSNQPIGVQVAGGNELTDAEALARARRMITLSNPGHPGATPGFEDNRSLQSEALLEAYVEGYARTTLGVASFAVGPEVAVAGNTIAGRALAAALATQSRSGFVSGVFFGFGESLLPPGAEVAPEFGTSSFQRGRTIGGAVGTGAAVVRDATGPIATFVAELFR